MMTINSHSIYYLLARYASASIVEYLLLLLLLNEMKYHLLLLHTYTNYAHFINFGGDLLRIYFLYIICCTVTSN